MKLENIWDDYNANKRNDISTLGEIKRSSIESVERIERNRCDYVAAILKNGKNGNQIYNDNCKTQFDTFKEQFDEGDSVVEYDSMIPGLISGSKGYAIIRRGKIVARYAYMMC